MIERKSIFEIYLSNLFLEEMLSKSCMFRAVIETYFKNANARRFIYFSRQEGKQAKRENHHCAHFPVP